MSIEVKFRRGTSAEHGSFTGANGEITIDTTAKTIRVHDGVTTGGIRIAKLSEVVDSSNLEFVTTNIVPASNVSLDLGTAERSWRDLYLSGNTITLGDSTISTDAGSVSFQDTDGQQVQISASTVKLGSGNTAIILGSSSGSLSINGGDVTLANVSITNLVLENVLGTQYGGTGLTSFTENGILFASNSSVLSFVTGTSGKVMQVGSNGVPEFNDLDGGNFT